MHIQDIKELMDKMSQTGMNILELEADGTRLRLERNGADAPAPLSSELAERAAIACRNAADAAMLAAEGVSASEAQAAGHLVTSPVVGIFYAAPSPDSDPFVSVNSLVETGSTLCIIEAMKLMNEVTSAWTGIVLEILVDNGQRVEYGQPLMRIGGN